MSVVFALQSWFPELCSQRPGCFVRQPRNKNLPYWKRICIQYFDAVPPKGEQSMRASKPNCVANCQTAASWQKPDCRPMWNAFTRGVACGKIPGLPRNKWNAWWRFVSAFQNGDDWNVTSLVATVTTQYLSMITIMITKALQHFCGVQMFAYENNIWFVCVRPEFAIMKKVKK